MKKEQITDKEGICIFVLFLIGSTHVIGIGGDAKNDAWLAGIAGILMALPMLAVYARILSIFPGKELYEILEKSMGKIASRIIALIYIWYSFHLGAMILRNFGEFINTMTMPETPIIVPMSMLGLICIISVKLGIEVIGRACTYFVPVILLVIAAAVVLGLGDWNLNYLKPIMHHTFGVVMKGGFSAFSFPFAETVLFMGVFNTLKTKKSPYKVYFFGALIAGVIIVTLTIRNIAVLGNMLGMYYFPSYIAVGRIDIGDFLQRLEGTVAIVMLVGVFIKSSVCLFVACKGLARMFGLTDYKSIVIQLGLLMIFFSYIVYGNIMEMRYWAFKVYQYYAFPMQVLLPLVIWIFTEVKHRKIQAENSSLSP
jgi:spore germination protein KB